MRQDKNDNNTKKTNAYKHVIKWVCVLRCCCPLFSLHSSCFFFYMIRLPVSFRFLFLSDHGLTHSLFAIVAFFRSCYTICHAHTHTHGSMQTCASLLKKIIPFRSLSFNLNTVFCNCPIQMPFSTSHFTTQVM